MNFIYMYVLIINFAAIYRFSCDQRATKVHPEVVAPTGGQSNFSGGGPSADSGINAEIA